MTHPRKRLILLTAVALAFFASESFAFASFQTAAPSPQHPTVVRVGLAIRNLAAIDEVKETWQVTGVLTAKWSDPRLRYRRSENSEYYRDLPATIWRPTLEFTNEVTSTNFRLVDFYAYPDGSAVFTQAFNATLSTDLDLRRFPFDTELLPLVVQAGGDDVDRTILRADPPDSTVLKRAYARLAQWVPLSLSARLGTVP
ncbi:MAG: hypothetical protein JO104_06905, partial [Candidatus Eremiobacteraeota bacterium]|nr:hypothetical protein [Candidatus Eremiobacteraeota bacterium]